jgi:hypothetical protein
LFPKKDASQNTSDSTSSSQYGQSQTSDPLTSIFSAALQQIQTDLGS